ncbi:hypothetical protein AAE478_009275 [Parahypoxylon ruwenzoriense]
MTFKPEVGTEELPTLPQEVTAEWLGLKLGHKIKSISLASSLFGTASKLFFAIEYEDEVADPSSRPTHICVKGVFEPVIAASQPWTLSLAQREADFFAKIAPSIKHAGYPRGWWAGTNVKQGISIMSDLAQEGCTFPSDAASYPLEKVLDGATQLAGLHAQFWGKSQEDYPWIWNNYDPAMRFIVEPWDRIVREPGRPKLPEYLLDSDRVKKAQEKYYSRRNPKFRTLLHGDTHLGNLYFTAEGHTRFLDWSAYHFGSCFHDLVYLVSTVLTIEDRRAHEMEVLDHYLEALHRLGGPKLDRNDEELMVEYKRCYLTNLVWIICPHELQKKERVDALFERTIAAWDDHKVIEVVEKERLV